MSKINLQAHPVHKEIPQDVEIKGDSDCVGCSFNQKPGHEIAVKFSPNILASGNSRKSLKEMATTQWMVRRRQLDVEGMPGMAGSPLYYYNATGSFNYADFTTYVIQSVVGDIVTCVLPTDPRGIKLYTTRVRNANPKGGYVNGLYLEGVNQAGDLMVFQKPSKAGQFPITAQIHKITDATETTIKFQIDKEVTGATISLNPPDGFDGNYTVKVYQQAGNAEDWHFLNPPTWFRSIMKQLKFLASSVDTVGLIQLSENKPVAHNPGLNPAKQQAFGVRGLNKITGAMEDLLAVDSRLFISIEGPSYFSIRGNVPDNASPIYADLELRDLTEDYSYFEITYYELLNDDEDGACAVPCHATCYWDRVDFSQSNYNATDGVGVDKQGQHRYCAARKTTEFPPDEYVDTSEPPDGFFNDATPKVVRPSQIDKYKPGACTQLNTCSHFKAAENLTDRNAPYRDDLFAGRYFREIWGAGNTLVTQKTPRVSYPSNYVISRIKHPSLSWITGWFPVDSPTTIDQGVTRIYGSGYWTEPVTVSETDSEGKVSQYLSPRTGWNWELLDSRDPEYPIGAGPAPDGFFARNITDFNKMRDPLGKDLTLTQNDIERMGIRIERNTAELDELCRGVSAFPDTIDESPVIIPNVSILDKTSVQTRGLGSFERLETVEVINGVSIGGIISIDIMRPEQKPEISIGQRKIVYLKDNNDDTFTIDLENTSHVWSFIDDGPDLFDSFDHKISWQGGGGAPIFAPDYQQINSFYEPHTSLGSRYGGAARGDCVGIGLESFEDWRFILNDVIPFGGFAPLNWGDHHTSLTFNADIGFFRANEAYCHIPDPTGGDEVIIGKITAVEDESEPFVAFSDVDPLEPLVAMTDGVRPDFIPLGSYWFDQSINSIYFSPAETREIRIYYRVVDQTVEDGESAEYYTQIPLVDVLTPIHWSDWNDAVPDSIMVSYSETGVPLNSSPVLDPEVHYYRAESFNYGGTDYLKIFISPYDAGKSIKVEFDRNIEAPTPKDYYSFGGDYTAYGKKRDRITIVDESGVIRANLAEIDGKLVTFYWNSGVWVPPVQLKWTTYKKDEWVDVGFEHLIYEHGRGKIHIKESWFVDKPGKVCFKL